MAIRLRASAAVTLAVSGNWADTPTYGVMWIGSVMLDSAAISPALTETPENGDTLRIVAQGAPFDLTVTGASEVALNAIIAAGLDEITCTVSLHDGAPGSNGTANEIAVGNNAGYARLTVPLESAVV